VLRRAPELLENIKVHSPISGDHRLYSNVWKDVVAIVLTHLSGVIEEGMSRGAVALAPSLALRNPITKAELRQANRDLFLSFALRNSGKGHAHDISLQKAHEAPVRVLVVEPTGPFDIPPGGEQLIRLQVRLNEPARSLEIPIKWVCQTPAGQQADFPDKIAVSQQVTEPNWELLVTDPPYSLNPIRRPDRLYGREAALQRLMLAARSGSSEFVWGQKRIGKTSLLQVLATKLSERADTICIILRMGELISLHEGEIGRLIAERLKKHSGAKLVTPSEAEFGASIGRLVSFVEELCVETPNHKYIVVIDEFDDLDPTFYIGERGKQFIKALRSISEVGLAFFFVGSERMETIYHRHQADLNKWTNVHLDRIDSRTECRALITTPVADVIEFSREATDFIIDYCDGNPFYINNFCYQIFERCLQEHRTFVDDNDSDAVRHQLLRALGPTNFSHFWEDNPLLDPEERVRAAAENCVALACISALGGRYEQLEDLYDVQDALPMVAADRASANELRDACTRLVARKIISLEDEDSGSFAISLPILRDWLAENGVSNLTPIWVTYTQARREAKTNVAPIIIPEQTFDVPNFVIPEDDLIPVSQRLVFCGKQKDVADIRSWLRQFDDDARIEVAFLLLKRLAERGFINEGARSLALARLEEMIKARRQEVGEKAWKIERGRHDNLCLAYVDSELKSGAATARELRNMMRPGKSGSTTEINTWMRSHLNDDPMVVVVDDFAGTGRTLVKGLDGFRKSTEPRLWRTYIEQGRVSLFLMFAFPEAIELIRKEHPGVNIVAANTLGEELRAFSEEAKIFEAEKDRRFARDIMLQIGRELYPAQPLGFGDLGALVAFHNAAPNNALPIFWCNGPSDKRWNPIFPRA
jgi:hypothetical protein